jgi:hypothetical protein
MGPKIRRAPIAAAACAFIAKAENQAEADPGLLRIIVRAHDFHERLIRNPI